MSVAAFIKETLEYRFAGSVVAVENESSLHRGHAGYHESPSEGESHFRVRMVSPAFEGVNRVARHRMVYAALDGLAQGRIHALALELCAPSEA